MAKTTFTSKINGNDIYAKRAEATRSGVNLETFTEGEGDSAKTTQGILPAGIATPSDAEDIANILATQQYVKDAFSVADALVYKGALAGGSTGAYGALTPAATKGDVYKVSNAGKIDGIAVEVGDMLICNSDNTDAATAENYSTIAGKWDVIQVNIDGAVVGPASAVDGNIALFDGTTGKTIKNGANLALSNSPASKAIVTNAQGAIVDADLSTAAPSASGDTLAFIDSVSQDSQGKITATKKSVTVDSTYSASGTNPVNGTAVTAALATLDVGDLVQDTEGNKAGKTLKTLSETDGKITATFQDIKITSDKVTDRQTSTFNGTADTLTTGTAVKAAIDALDVTDLVQDSSGSMAGKTLLTLSETSGKIAATFQNIQIAESQVTNLTTDLAAKADKVTTATNGNFAGLDSNGNLTDSGYKAADFATAAQGAKADTAIQGVMLNNVELTKDANNKVNIPYDTSAHQGSPSDPGLMTYETIDL